MLFYKEIRLADGRQCIFRNAEASDAQAFISYYMRAHGETDFLTTYPDEAQQDPEKMAARLSAAKESNSDIEICAFIDGKLAGSAGNNMIHNRDKTRHRASFGISILKEYWGLGIGSLLTEYSIECAQKAGFLQLELDVVADNLRAIGLYKKFGFTEFGRNPRGFRNRQGNWQELVLMRLELDRQ